MTRSDATPAASGGNTKSPEQLREEIEQTRAQLGDTVEALAHKADVKERARQKATEVAERAKHTAADRTHAAQRTAAELKERVGEKTTDLTSKARELTPEQARQYAGTAARTAKDKRGPIAALVAGLVLMGWLVRRRRRR